MKTCPNCKTEKDLKHFHFKKSENRHNSWCKSCVYELQKIRWRDKKRKAVELLGGKCSECKYRECLAAMEFHHIDPKQKDVSWNKLRLRSWDKIVEELQKCVLLCCRCHRELHWPDDKFEDSGKSNIRLNSVIQPSGSCLICNSDVFGTTYCSHACSQMARRKTKRPTKEELKVLLEDNTWTALGKRFNVSDNAVRKWAKSYGIL